MLTYFKLSKSLHSNEPSPLSFGKHPTKCYSKIHKKKNTKNDEFIMTYLQRPRKAKKATRLVIKMLRNPKNALLKIIIVFHDFNLHFVAGYHFPKSLRFFFHGPTNRIWKREKETILELKTNKQKRCTVGFQANYSIKQIALDIGCDQRTLNIKRLINLITNRINLWKVNHSINESGSVNVIWYLDSF